MILLLWFIVIFYNPVVIASVVVVLLMYVGCLFVCLFVVVAVEAVEAVVAAGHPMSTTTLEDISSLRVKLLCSFDGKILPRPGDGRLRYVGGETRIITVNHDISYAELVFKVTEICGYALTLKYQLPDEDLDALVSVSSDEDLENMMEEYDKLRGFDGISRLRVFLFPAVEYDVTHLSDDSVGDQRNPDQRYVDAVNGVPKTGSRKHSETGGVGVPSIHSDNLIGLDVVDLWSATSVSTGLLVPQISQDVASLIHAPVSSLPLSVSSFHTNADAEDIQASNGAQQLQQQQQHFHPQHSNSKTNYQNAVLPVVLPALKKPPIHSQYQDWPENVPDWGVQQQGSDMDDTWVMEAGREGSQLDYLEEDTSAADIRVTHAMEASRSGGGCYPHLPEDADALLATSPAEPFQQMKVDWADPFGNSNLHLRPPSVPQSNVMSGYSPALGRVATFRDGSSKASSPYVGGQGSNDPDFLALLPPPRCGDSSTIQDLRSTSSFLDVCGSHLPPLIPSAQMQSASSGGPLVEDRATPIGFKQMATSSHPLSTGDIQWGRGFIGSDDAEDDGIGMFGMSSAAQLQSGGSVFGGGQGEPSRPRIGNNTIGSTEEEPRKGVQVSSDEMQRKAGRGISDDEDGMHTLYGRRDPVLDDRPLHKVQLPLSTMELHATPLPPPTGKMISNVIPTASIQEFATANTLTSHMPLSYLYPNKRLLPEHTPSSCATAAINVGVVMPKTISPGSENIESFERKPGFHKKYDNMSSLDLSASGGNLALDMASAVFSKQSATPLERRKNDLSEDGKGTWLHDFQAPFISSPIFGLQSWEENLANLEKEFDGVSLKQQSLNDDDHAPEEAIFEKIEVKDQHFVVDGLMETIKNDDLEELRELGSGTYGTVYHGKWRGTDVAIKRIRASCFAGQPSEKERLIADFWKEACTLSQLHHPNVVAFYGVVRDGPGGTLATVTEYMVNGSLKQVLQKNDRTIDRHKRLLLATDAAFGMEYLHEKNIVHFDLKCENLLVNMRDPQRPICKVGDLGLSKVKQQTMVSGGIRGTLPWMAPELLNSTSNMVTEKVDVFSFGIVMWELLTGEEPYANLHYGAIIGGIVNNTLRPKVPTWCDPSWKLLMERCWASEPVDRPGFTDIASNLRAMTAATHPKAQGQFHVTLLP
ncbi:unnamed protein product [Sphagnum jensenii]